MPCEEIVAATSKLLLNPRSFDNEFENRHPLAYGSNIGALWVRQEIAKFINKAFGPECGTTEDFINLTPGASYGMMNILTQTTLAHTGYTKQAFIITPTYFLANDIFIDAGFAGKMTAIDETGKDNEYQINFELLESKLKEFSSVEDAEDYETGIKPITGPKLVKKIYRFVLYCIPSFSNPGGLNYNLKTRLRLIELARQYDMLVISDDVYDLLDYVQPLNQLPRPLPRLTHLDRLSCENEFGNTISNSTFSKLIAPGLRFGYQESVNHKLVYQLSEGGANVSGGSPAQLNSMIVGTLLKSGAAETIINNYRTHFVERAKLIKQLVKDHLPEGTIANGFDGGYFVWVTLPPQYNASEICAELSKKKVKIPHGGSFEVTNDTRGWDKSCVRLSLSYLEPHQLRKAFEIWGQTISDMYGRK